MLSWLAKQLISGVMWRTRAGHDYPVAHEPALAAGAQAPWRTSRRSPPERTAPWRTSRRSPPERTARLRLRERSTH